MNEVLVISIGIRVAALAWSIVLLRRMRDWRMLFLSAMLLFMAARQALTLFSAGAGADPTTGWREFPGLIVSIMALLAVLFLDRLLFRHRRVDAASRRFHELLEATPDFVGMSDRDGRVLYVNPAGRAMAGRGRHEDLSGLTIRDFHPEAEANRILEEKLPAALRDGIWLGETTFRRAGADPMTASQMIVTHRDDKGSVQFVSTIARDVTREKAAQAALLSKTAQLAAFTDAMTIFLESGDFRRAAARLLRSALDFTGSEYGFLGVVTDDTTLRVLAHEGIEWDAEIGRELYESAMTAYRETGYLEFSGLDNLFGRVITDGSALISNEPETDARRGGLPAGHPPLHHFLGVPIRREHEVVGMIGVANRSGGYGPEQQEEIEILSRATGVLFDSYRRELREQSLESDRHEARQALRETERRYERILEDLPDLICRFKPDTTITFVNEAYARYFGRSREALVGTSFLSLVPEPDRSALRAHIDSLGATNPIKTIEHHVLTGEGEVRWQSWTDRALLDDDGRVTELQSIGRDITEQKLAEEALRESESRYRSVVEGQTEFIVRWLPDGTRTFVNDAYCRYFGLTREQCIGTSFMPLVAPEDRAMVTEKLASIRPESPTATDQHRVVRPDQSIGWQEWTDHGIFDEAGRLVELQSIGRDITEQKLAEEALRESEERFRQLATQIHDVFYLVELETGRTLYVSPAYAGIWGRPCQNLLDDSNAWLEPIHPDDRPRVERSFTRQLQGEPFEETYRVRRPDGSEVWIRDRGFPVQDETGKVVRTAGLAEDITDSMKAERSLRESEERFRSVAENVPGVVYSYEHRDGQPRTLIYLGPGLEELIGDQAAAEVAADFDTLFERLHSDDVQPLRHAALQGMDAGRLVDHECRLRHEDGSYIWVRSLARGVPLADGGSRWHVVLIDITERKQIEAEQQARLKRARRMESTIARLASSTDESIVVEQSLRRITEAAAEALEVERVGIWMLSDDRRELRCVDLYEARRKRHSAGQVLRADDYPDYFQALGTGRAVAASDARSDPRTRDFRAGYLEPHGIESMLDAAIRRSGRVVGVVCHEHTGSPRQWTADEIAFGTEMADQVAQVLLDDDRRRAEAALRESEELYRTMVQHAPEAIVVYDIDAGRFVDANENAEQLFGLRRDELFQLGPSDVSPPRQPDGRESAQAARAYVAQALAGEPPVFEWTHRDARGRDIPCEVRLVRLPSSTRRLVRGSVTDITERKEAERRQKMMMNELDHRVKNNLAAVMALARHSAGSARSLGEFSEAFTGRIAAMARTHESLARAKWEGIGLEEVARLTLDAYLHGDKPRVVLAGPRVVLAPESAMPLCLTLHELATNAAKHGALSNERGCVHVDWQRPPDGRVKVTWVERDGPPVTVPGRGGIGTSLIEGFISYELRGELNVEYEREGIRCEMTIPVAT